MLEARRTVDAALTECVRSLEVARRMAGGSDGGDGDDGASTSNIPSAATMDAYGYSGEEEGEGEEESNSKGKVIRRLLPVTRMGAGGNPKGGAVNFKYKVT
jgi:hypothetical protein